MFYIFADGELLYSSIQPENRLILAPTCTLEVGMSGSVDFTILPGHALYDSIDKLKTKIVVYMDDEMIFNGRVLNWDIDFYKQKTVHCEGDLSYLLDTLQPPRSIETTVSTYFGYIIDEHNIQVETGKRFTKGTVNIDDAATTALFENNGYRDTRSAIDSDLIGVYGGFLRTRTVGAVTYLDYVKEYGTTSTQTLEFSSNIIDMSQTLSAADIFTVLLPTGDWPEVESEGGELEEPPLEESWPLTIEEVNGGSKLLENADGISKFGRIVHTQHFSGVTDAATLKSKAEAYFARMYREPPVSFTIRALDLHFYNASLDQFLVGQNINIISSPHGVNTTLTCLSINYDIENVENTELTIGTLTSDVADPGSHFAGGLSSPGGAGSGVLGPSLSSTVGEAISGPSGGKIGQLYKHITEGDDWLKLQAKNIDILGENINLKVDKNGVKAAINLSPEGTKIFGTNVQITGQNGLRLTAGVMVDKDLKEILDDAYTQISMNETDIALRVQYEDDIAALINLDEHGTLIYGKNVNLIGENGFKFTAGGTVEIDPITGDVKEILDHTFSQIEADRSQIRLRVKYEDDLAALINLDEHGTLIYGKNVNLIGENGFKFTAGGTVEIDPITGDVKEILDHTFSQIEADRSQIRLRVKYEDDIAALINLDEHGTLIYGKNVNLIGENGFTFTAGGSIEVDPLTGDIKEILDTTFSRIKASKDQIDLRVTKAGVINAINISTEGITIDGTKITLNGTEGIIVKGNLVVQSELSATNATISNLMTGTTTATAIKAANLQSTGSISAGVNITAANALNGEYLNVTTGAITTLTSSTLNGTIINLNGTSLATLLSGKSDTTHEHSSYDHSFTALTGANVYNAIGVTNGIVTALSSRALTPADIGAAASTHNHDTVYATIAGLNAVDAALDDYALLTHNHSTTYLGISAKAADSDKLDGYHASDFTPANIGAAPASHTHTMAGITDFPTRTSATFVTGVNFSTKDTVTVVKTLSPYETASVIKNVVLGVSTNTYYFYT